MSFSISLQAILNETRGETLSVQDTTFSGVVIDGRKATPGALFVAIRGEAHDGHDFVSQAIAHGATGIIASNAKMQEMTASHPGITIIAVSDTILALGQIAAYHHRRSIASRPIPVIGITGSYGKTSCKELLGFILAAHTGHREDVLLTDGNLNNHIGVPLTLLQLREHHKYAVIEMGMSNLGEIAYVASLCTPQIGIITNVGPAHLETLGSIQNIAKAKGELFFALSSHGVAIFLDGSEHQLIREQAQQAGVSAGTLTAWTASVSTVPSPTTKVMVEVVSTDMSGSTLCMKFEPTVDLPQEEASVHLPLLGSHQAKNAALAATAARYLGVSAKAIGQGISRVSLHHHRGERIACAARTIIDDCYNANPASVMAAAATLGSLSTSKKSFFILGDMLELGPEEIEFHKQVGIAIAAQPIDGLFTFGSRSQFAAQAAAQAGIPTYPTSSIDALASAVLKHSEPGDLLWVKGSRGMQLERLYPLLDELFSRL